MRVILRARETGKTIFLTYWTVFEVWGDFRSVACIILTSEKKLSKMPNIANKFEPFELEFARRIFLPLSGIMERTGNSLKSVESRCFNIFVIVHFK